MGLFFYNDFKCLENQFDVAPKRMFFHVFKIELYLVLHNHVNVVLVGVFGTFEEFVFVAVAYRSRIGDAWSYIEDVELFFGPEVDIVPDFGTRANQTHFAFEDVDELRKFVKFVFADEVSGACYPWVAAADSYEAALVGACPHGSEFVQEEIPVSTADTRLPVEDSAFRIIDFYPDGDCKECRA